MSLNAAAIETLIAKGLSAADILDVARAMEKKADPTNAARQARHREKQRNAVTVTTVTPSPNERDNLTPTREEKTEAKASSKKPDEETLRAVSTCLRGAFPAPDGVTDDQWAAFRRQRKKAINDRSYALLTAKLAKLAEAGWPPGEMIDLAIERGWETVFEPKDYGHGRTDRMGRHQPADGLSSTARAAIAVFGAPSPR